MPPSSSEKDIFIFLRIPQFEM